MKRLTPHSLKKFLAAAGLAALTGITAITAAQADTPTRINFTLDWRFEGPSAPFLMALEQGYFADEGLDVRIDSGNGSAGAVTRVATGSYDMGFADFNALVEYAAANPGSGIQAVYMVYNHTPAAIFSLKETDINHPSDLAGKTLGAPVFDGGRKAWPAFAAHNDLALDAVSWQSVDPAIRETLLARRQIDAISGFYFTSLLNLEARGIATEEINILPYSEYGVALYGNAIIASEELLTNQPEAVAGFNRAFNRALIETLEDPEAAIEFVRQRDSLINPEMEVRRLKLALDAQVITEETLANGLGAVDPERLKAAIQEAVTAFDLERTPSAESLFNTELLPSLESRLIEEKAGAAWSL